MARVVRGGSTLIWLDPEIMPDDNQRPVIA
jgi:hypothetical protein